jgi:hypothetical protein
MGLGAIVRNHKGEKSKKKKKIVTEVKKTNSAAQELAKRL